MIQINVLYPVFVDAASIINRFDVCLAVKSFSRWILAVYLTNVRSDSLQLVFH